MFDAGRRPSGRLFYWLVAVMMIAGSGLMAGGAAAVPQSGPATTTIADTVYLADGSTAQGNLRRYVEEHGAIDGQTSPMAIINTINNGCMEAFGEDVDDTTSVVQAISGNLWWFD